MRHAFAFAALLLVAQNGCTATTALRAWAEAGRQHAVHAPPPGSALELLGDGDTATVPRAALSPEEAVVAVYDLLEALLMLPAIACDLLELAVRLPFGGG